MFTVHVRITDSSAGKPTAARLRITDGNGVCCPPLGRQAHFRTGPGEDVGGQVLLEKQAFAYVDGACEVPLPAGTITLEIAKGNEYKSVRRQIALADGQMALRLSIDRWTDERIAGWYAGDIRAHDLTPHAALLEGAAEGLAVVQLLARERPPNGAIPPAVSNLLAFSGTTAALSSTECLVAVNTLNTHTVLGSVSLLNCHRPVFPLRFGAPGEPDDWSVADWCDQCHRKKGLVVWPDLPRLTDEHRQGEALAAMVLGKIDAFEVGPGADFAGSSYQLYYRLLNRGLRPVLVGGSGKDSNAVPLGAVRTYARLLSEQKLEPATWIEAVRAGRTFVTNGPILSLSAADQGPGNTLTVEPGTEVPIHAQVRSALPIESIEVLAGGKVVAAAKPSGEQRSVELQTALVCDRSTWIAARCCGPTGQQAHTTPIHLQVPGQPMLPSGEQTAPLMAVLERTLDWVNHRANCPTERQRRHLQEILDEALARLLGTHDHARSSPGR
jgi:hypothetical protein